ncbi:Subtilase family protein [Micromonospora rhizosphaerae]|uniref:Subtilase family protein n=1 Tax=Micromonospora rhizosphaerae TaxID=568872 RepID=A0A1C6SJK4_9ACTN|nr:S8/S53 family peptidase [Micromonospora rhizosphaerae]SCL29429.1 Subtilase family protein [Micromonospora rhizosphaerae]
MGASGQEIQWELLKGAFAAAGRPVEIGAGRCRDADAEFLYEAGRLLVREEHVAAVRDILDRLYLLPGRRRPEPERETAQGRPRPTEEPVVEPVIAGVRAIRLAFRDRDDDLRGYDTIRALRLLLDGGRVEVVDPSRPDERRTEVIEGFGTGAASLNHVVHISGDAAACPAVEPEPVPAGSPPDPGYALDRGAGEGVKVVIVDTGLDPEAAVRSPWLAGVTGQPDPGVDTANHTLNEYAGHGTFIAGVVRGVAPRAEVHVRSVINFGGGVLESDLIQALDAVLVCDHPDVISMSAGTYAYDASGMLAFQAFHERRLSHHKGVVLVVAAGNDADRKPFWPAAAPYTVSVGALAATGRGRAGFSNFGGWVDVYAPGQDLVNAFPTGTYTYREPPYDNPPRVETFHGMARWSGTSFSTPVVAGLIAARMSRTGENGRTAARSLIRKARKQAQPGVGAVLLPE